MEEVKQDIDRWLAERQIVALATVVQTWGSAPRKAGAKMGVTGGGGISGSVSGGCVEGAVVTAAEQVLENGRPTLLHFGVADETAWEVGLACGGEIEIFVEPLNRRAYDFVTGLQEREQSGLLATVIQGPDELVGNKLAIKDGALIWDEIGTELEKDTLKMLQEIKKTSRLILRENLEVFVEVLRPAPMLVIVGGVHIAVALIHLANELGFRTILVDPRRAFNNLERFPHAGKLLQEWPGEGFSKIAWTAETAVALLTHDPKIDDPALLFLQDQNPFYVGALGSRATHQKRKERLLAAGINPDFLDTVHAPIGLDIGAQNPEEIALSVMAEIISSYRNRS